MYAQTCEPCDGIGYLTDGRGICRTCLGNGYILPDTDEFKPKDPKTTHKKVPHDPNNPAHIALKELTDKYEAKQ